MCLVSRHSFKIRNNSDFPRSTCSLLRSRNSILRFAGLEDILTRKNYNSQVRGTVVRATKAQTADCNFVQRLYSRFAFLAFLAFLALLEIGNLRILNTSPGSDGKRLRLLYDSASSFPAKAIQTRVLPCDASPSARAPDAMTAYPVGHRF